MADCGPGRLTVQKELSVETVTVVLEELKVFLEQEQVEEVMMDMVFQNSFKSSQRSVILEDISGLYTDQVGMEQLNETSTIKAME